MNDTVTVALISLAGTLCGTFGGILMSNRLTNYRIEQLEQKVEKHNNLVERTYRLEELQQVTDERLRVANHRIEDLERKEEQRWTEAGA
jgi:hypothetical protein